MKENFEELKNQLICSVVEKLENKMTGSGQAGAMGMSHCSKLGVMVQIIMYIGTLLRLLKGVLCRWAISVSQAGPGKAQVYGLSSPHSVCTDVSTQAMHVHSFIRCPGSWGLQK